MVYSDVINNNYHLLLNKKKIYTVKDIDKVQAANKQFTRKEARFIVLCTSIFHDSKAQNKVYKMA